MIRKGRVVGFCNPPTLRIPQWGATCPPAGLRWSAEHNVSEMSKFCGPQPMHALARVQFWISPQPNSTNRRLQSGSVAHASGRGSIRKLRVLRTAR
jgi:hypothetical protein